MGKNFNVQKALSAGMTPGQIQSYVSQNNLIADAPIPGVAQPQVLSAQAPQTDFNSSVGNFINNNVIKPTVDTLSTPLRSILGAAVQTPLTGLYRNAVETQVDPRAPKVLQEGAKSGADILNSILQPLSKFTEYTPENQNKTVQQAEKQIANLPALVSYGIPFGKTGIPGSRYLIPGAITGGLNNLSGQLKEQLNNGQDLNPSQINIPQLEGAAVTGGITGQVTGSAMDLLSGLLGLGEKAGNNISNKLSDTANSKVLKASPSAAANAADERGFDLGKLYEKYFNGKTDYNEILGNVSEKNGGGILGNKLQQAEDQIQQTIDNSGSTIRISGEDFVKELKSQRKILASTVGNSDKISALNNIIDETEKLFKNGMTARKLLSLKRAADSQFGKAVVEEQTGSVASSAQKMIANTARQKLKSLFPELANALDTQSELYTLKPVLAKARGSAMVASKSGIPLGDIAASLPAVMGNPVAGATLLATKKAVESPAMLNNAASVISRLGQGATNVGNVLNSPVIKNIAEQSAIRSLTSSGQSAMNQKNQNQNDSTDLNHISDYTNSGQQYQTASNEITPEMVAAAKLYLPSQLSDRVEAAYKAQSGGATAQQAGLVRAGLKNVNDVESMLKEDPNLLAKQLIPGKIASRKFDSAIYDAADSLLRLRTGATANPSEIKAYANSIAPSFGDSKEVIAYKIAKLRSDLNSYIGK